MKRHFVIIAALAVALLSFAAPARAQIEPQKVVVTDPTTGVALFPFGSVAIGTPSAGIRVGPFGCYVEENAPTYTTGQIHPCSLTTDGRVRVEISGAVSAVGTITNPVTVTGSINVGNGSTTVTADGDLPAGAAGVAQTATELYYYNGTSLVRARQSPCLNNSLLQWFVVDIVTATTVEIVNGAGVGNHVYICGVFLGPTGGAQNLTLVEDDTDNCPSPTAGIFGGVTAAEGWNMAANGGTNISGGSIAAGRTSTTNRFVCLISSTAQQVSGTIAYAIAP